MKTWQWLGIITSLLLVYIVQQAFTTHSLRNQIKAQSKEIAGLKATVNDLATDMIEYAGKVEEEGHRHSDAVSEIKWELADSLGQIMYTLKESKTNYADKPDERAAWMREVWK